MTGGREPRVSADADLHLCGEVPFRHHFQPAGGPDVVHVHVDSRRHYDWPSVTMTFDRAGLAATIDYLTAVAAEWSGTPAGGAR